MKWIVTNWAPQTPADGLTYFAHVVSSESRATQSAKSMVSGFEGQLTMHMFGNIEEAPVWLRAAQQHKR